MQQVFRVGVLVSALLIGMAGCTATKDWFRNKADWVRNKWGGHGAANATAQNSANTVHVIFASDRWDLDRVAQADLVRLTRKLRENPSLRLRLEGYTDSAGSPDYNLQLSHKRVDAVRRFLVEKGVEPTRIRSVSVGELRDHAKPAEQARNRRVTVKLVSASD